MDIRWLGQSTFEIKSALSTVIFDPFPGLAQPVLLEGGQLIVTTSGATRDAVDLNPWPGLAKIVEGPGEYEIGGLAFRGVPVPFADPATRKYSTAFALEVERLVVCHLGPLQSPLSSHAQQILGAVDIALVPAAGEGVLSAERTAETVRQLDPKIVVPMYYGSLSPEQAAAAIDQLVKEIGVAATDPAPRLSVSRSNLPQELRVQVLRASTD